MRSEWKIGIVVGVVLVVVLIVFQIRKDPSQPDQPQDGTLMQVGDSDGSQPQPHPPAPPLDNASGTPTEPGSDAAGMEPDIEIVMPDGVDPGAEATGSAPGGDDVVPALRQYSDLTDPIVVPEPVETREPQYYVVQKSDNLSDISEKYYGHGRYWNEIYRANRDLIKNPDVLQVGWKLRIPYPEEIAARLEGAAPAAN